jgi:hypothetical protein
MARAECTGRGSEMKFVDTRVGKLLIMVAVGAVGIYCLYISEPPPAAKTNPFQNYPELNGDLRYCFAEEIRLDGARSVLDDVEPADIERFNRMVAAYNQSCSSRREKRRIFEVIQSEVRANRNALWAEGIARFPAAAERRGPVAGRT